MMRMGVQLDALRKSQIDFLEEVGVFSTAPSKEGVSPDMSVCTQQGLIDVQLLSNTQLNDILHDNAGAL